MHLQTTFDGTIPETSETSALATKIQLAGFGEYRQLADRILTELGIAITDDLAWIPTRTLVECHRRTRQTVGDKIVRQIGMLIPEHFPWSSSPQNAHEALDTVHSAFLMSHRHGDIGGYAYSRTGERSGDMLCRNPYSCPLDEGLITAVARRFGPLAVVTHMTGDCRDQGDLQCRYHVRW